MEEMQRKFRDELDAIRQSWGARLGSGSVTPRYDFSRLPPFQRIARAAGGHGTRVEMIYEQLQEEIRHWQAQAGNDEYLVVSAGATPVDIIQIGNISYRNPDLLILEGVDDTGQRTRILAPAGTVQLVMKIVKAKGEESEPSV